MAAATALGGCGEEDEGDIGATDARAMLVLIDRVEDEVRSRRCDAALATAGELESEVANLTDASQETINALAGATESLKSLIIEQCNGAEPTTTTTDRDTTTTTQTTTVPTTTSTTTRTQTTSTTSTDEQTTTTDDDDTGGVPSGGGIPAPGNGNQGAED